MKKARTWVLIADAGRARILEHVAGSPGLAAVDGQVFEADHAATRDLVTDQPGRSFSSASPRRSSMEAPTDPHRELKTRFAHHLAGVLADAQARDAFDRLVVIAPPVMLGDLREAMAKAVAERVVGELHKDLTKVPNDEVMSHLGDIAL
ncbi:MAG: host attachment protein [Hyphomicrobiaceae bacterium]